MQSLRTTGDMAISVLKGLGVPYVEANASVLVTKAKGESTCCPGGVTKSIVRSNSTEDQSHATPTKKPLQLCGITKVGEDCTHQCPILAAAAKRRP